MHDHRPGGGVGCEPSTHHGAHTPPKFQKRIAERTRVWVPLRIVELEDEPFFHHHLRTIKCFNRGRSDLSIH